MVNKQSAKIIEFPVQTERTTHKQVNYLWDGNRQIQEQTDTHVFTTIYEQNSFEPVARLVWLQDGLTEPVNEPIYNDNPYIEPKIDKPPKIRVYHYHNDHLGTPNELTDQDGEVVWLADYEAWGNVAKVVWREEQLGQLKVSAEELQPLRFQGQSFDVETGLHYNRFRYFDPDLGMFTTRDPIGLMGGNNVFQYAPNPIGWVDPWGLSKVRRTQTKGDTDVVSARAARREAMRRNNIPTSQSYQSILTKDGVDGSGAQMYKETITTGGRNSGGATKVGEIKVHPEGHNFPVTSNKPETFEKPHYHGPKGEHISYDNGKPRSSNKYKGDDYKC